MINELSNKYIYNDFIEKTILNNEEKKILDMFIQHETLTKIAIETGMSERNVSRIIKIIKEKYKNYKEIQLVILKLFLS